MNAKQLNGKKTIREEQMRTGLARLNELGRILKKHHVNFKNVFTQKRTQRGS